MPCIWDMLIIFALIVEIICTYIIVHECWAIFKEGSFFDKLIFYLVTLLFLIALAFGGLFVNAISAKWEQSPVLAIPLLFVLITYIVKYILSEEMDNVNDSRIIIKHYFCLFKIFGLSYVISVLGYVGFNNIFNFSKISLFNFSIILILLTLVLFCITYVLSYSFVVFIFSHGKKVHENKKDLFKDIKRNDIKFRSGPRR